MRRAGRVGVVAKRQRRAGDTQLPCLAGLGDKAVVFVQQKNLFIGEGVSDGKHLLRGKGTIRQDVVGAVAGDLSRAVEVYETGLRQGGLPSVEMLYGHDLAAE